MYCKVCGKEIKSDSMFCSGCGVEIIKNKVVIKENQEDGIVSHIIELDNQRNEEEIPLGKPESSYEYYHIYNDIRNWKKGKILMRNSCPVHDGYAWTYWICVLAYLSGAIFGLIEGASIAGMITLGFAFSIVGFFLIRNILLMAFYIRTCNMTFFLPRGLQEEEFLASVKGSINGLENAVLKKNVLNYRGLIFTYYNKGDRFSIFWEVSISKLIIINGMGAYKWLYFNRGISCISELAYRLQQSIFKEDSSCTEFISQAEPVYIQVRRGTAQWIYLALVAVSLAILCPVLLMIYL